LIANNSKIFQCEINDFNFTLKKDKDIDSDIIDKYPGNKLIISKDKEIYIYEMKEIYYSYYCDGCRMNPLIGKRYRCEECENFDFCKSCCKEKKEIHPHTFKIISKKGL